MKEVELTELEAAKLKANQESINSMRQRMQQLQREIQEYQQNNLKVAEEIKARLKDPPDTPLEKWVFDEVDFKEFSGVVKIPELDEEEKHVQEN